MLLDSGAQVSLIRQETADTLGLNSKDVSVTKVGDEEETMKTKEYRVQLICIDNKRYTVNVKGIANIRNEIPKVKTSHLTELLGLQNTSFRHWKGHVDLLIVIDQAHMHAGETKEVNHLIARKSPLGWVVFRGKADETPDASVILHVTYTLPIDVTDF